MPSPSVLLLRAVFKRYHAGIPGCAASVTVLAGAALVVRAGERVALVGPRGSGKTTLLLLAAGLLRPDAGEAWRLPGAVLASSLPSPLGRARRGSDRTPGEPPDRLVWHHAAARGALLVEVPVGLPPPPWATRVVRVGGGGVGELGPDAVPRRAFAR